MAGSLPAANGTNLNTISEVELEGGKVKNGGTIKFIRGSEPNKTRTTASEVPAEEPVAAVANQQFHFSSADGKTEIEISTADSPDLTDWAHSTLAPVLAEWYPRITSQLAGTAYLAPARFTVTVKPMPGVAATSDDRIVASAEWLRSQRKGEAVGSLIHEMVHVIQQYGSNPENPGWLVEGIADYIRWFKFEPERHGADDVWLRSQGKQFSPRYDAGYRATANFLDWVSKKYDTNLVHELNVAMHERTYRSALWAHLTGHSLQDLGDEWRRYIETIGASAQ